jgi:deoxyribonuclease V
MEMSGKILHQWDVSPKEAVAIQRSLRNQVAIKGNLNHARRVAGADIALDKQRERGYAAVLVLDVDSHEVVETCTATGPLTFPYVPGLLTFREGPLLLKLLGRIESEPDIVFFDGQGYAHPRRMGIASHLGLWLGCPTVGLAKSRLCGVYREPAARKGSSTQLRHDDEVVGRVVRTRDGVRPIFVSPGHRLSIASAERWALRVSDGYRIPRPTRLADHLVGRLKRGEIEAQFHFEQER